MNKYILSNFIASLLVVFAFNHVLGQTEAKFQIIKTRGEIKLKKTNRLLKSKSTIYKSDSILFNSIEDRLLLINENQKLFIATPNDNLISYHLRLIKAKAKLRPGISNEVVSDLRKYFLNKVFLILGKEARISIDVEKYPLNEECFFYCRTYNHKNEQKLIQLSSEINQVIFSAEAFSNFDKTNELYYYSTGDGEINSEEICSFKLMLLDEIMLKNEIQIIIDAMVISSDKEKITNIQKYIFEIYGSPEESNLQNWLKNNFNLQSIKFR